MDDIGWGVSVSGSANEPTGDKLVLVRHDSPRIFLEVDVPGLRSAGANYRRQGREAIQSAIDALQAALR